MCEHGGKKTETIRCEFVAACRAPVSCGALERRGVCREAYSRCCKTLRSPVGWGCLPASAGTPCGVQDCAEPIGGGWVSGGKQCSTVSEWQMKTGRAIKRCVAGAKVVLLHGNFCYVISRSGWLMKAVHSARKSRSVADCQAVEISAPGQAFLG